MEKEKNVINNKKAIKKEIKDKIIPNEKIENLWFQVLNYGVLALLALLTAVSIYLVYFLV